MKKTKGNVTGIAVMLMAVSMFAIAVSGCGKKPASNENKTEVTADERTNSLAKEKSKKTDNVEFTVKDEEGNEIPLKGISVTDADGNAEITDNTYIEEVNDNNDTSVNTEVVNNDEEAVQAENLTEAPAERPAEPETEAPTERPTPPATEAPTSAPTEPEPEVPTFGDLDEMHVFSGNGDILLNFVDGYYSATEAENMLHAMYPDINFRACYGEINEILKYKDNYTSYMTHNRTICTGVLCSNDGLYGGFIYGWKDN